MILSSVANADRFSNCSGIVKKKRTAQLSFLIDGLGQSPRQAGFFEALHQARERAETFNLNCSYVRVSLLKRTFSGSSLNAKLTFYFRPGYYWVAASWSALIIKRTRALPFSACSHSDSSFGSLIHPAPICQMITSSIQEVFDKAYSYIEMYY